MRGFALDSPLYIRAYRDPAARAALRDFLAHSAPFVFVSSVVVFEVLSGARSDRQSAELRAAFFDPFLDPDRVFTPSGEAWERAAHALSHMATDRELDLKRIPKSFQNDVLLAASCADERLALITDNRGDFARIQRRIGFERVAPWPGALP